MHQGNKPQNPAPKRLKKGIDLKRFRRSLSVDLTIGMVVILVLIEGVLLFFLYQRQSNNLYREIVLKAEDYASKLSEVLAVPIWDFDDEQIGKIGTGFLQNELVRQIKITNQNGGQLFVMENNGSDGPMIGRAAEIRYNQQVIGHVEILLSTASYFEELNWLRNVLIGVLAFSVVVIFIASGLLLRFFLRKPLRVLSKGMDRIAHGEFDHQTQNLSYTELTGIAERFNQMASRIKARENALIDINRELQQVNDRLRQRFQYEQMLAEVSARAASGADFDRFIGDSLALIGKAVGSSWVGLFRNSQQGSHQQWICQWTDDRAPLEPPRMEMADGDPWSELIRSLHANQIFNWEKPGSENGSVVEAQSSAMPYQHLLAFPIVVQQAFFGGVLFGEKGASKLPNDAIPILETAVQIIVRFIESAQSREMLRRSEERFREMAEMLPETIFEIDEEGYLTFVNQSGLKQFGYSGHDLSKGLRAYDMFAEEERTRLEKNIRSILKGKAARLKEFRAKHKDGSYFPTMVSSSPIRKMDAVTGIRGFVIDISEKKNLEERLRKANRMEAIGNLAAGVAHDLNNILSGMVGYPDLLLLDLPAESPMRPPIEAVKNTGQKAAAVVQDLLTLARRNISELQVVGLNNIVNDYLTSPEFLKLKDRNSKISVVVDLADDLMNVLASSHHLFKGFMNLVVNAIEAMPAGGRLQVQTTNCYVDHVLEGYENIPEGEYIVLSVIDSGIGISNEDIQNIFEPFYTKKRMGRSGTGLGMSVVWATVKDHAGFVNVQSREGRGTRFDLYFPATREKIAPKPSQIPIDDYLGSEHILVVDDIPEQRQIAADMLERLGYTVQTVSSGEAAVELVCQQTMDLVILDMVMDPGIDGLETYQRILSLVPQQKAIIASGFAETERVRAALNLGAKTYLKKPYTLEKLGLSVRTALDGGGSDVIDKRPDAT